MQESNRQLQNDLRSAEKRYMEISQERDALQQQTRKLQQVQEAAEKPFDVPYAKMLTESSKRLRSSTDSGVQSAVLPKNIELVSLALKRQY